MIVPGSSTPSLPGSAVRYERREVERAELLPFLTAERLNSYLSATDNVEDAIRLYEWNMTASASVMQLTGIVEIVLRNALDRELQVWAAAKFSERSWFDRAPLDAKGRADLEKARSRATRNGKRPESHGRVVAELTLGFWRYLVESRYLTSLWMPATHKAFPRGPRDPRHRQREVKQRLQQLHFVRNRAAHHEPIHTRSLAKDFDMALELLEWMAPNTAAWANEIASLPRVITERP